MLFLYFLLFTQVGKPHPTREPAGATPMPPAVYSPLPGSTPGIHIYIIYDVHIFPPFHAGGQTPADTSARRCHADAPRGIQPSVRLYPPCSYIFTIYDVYIYPPFHAGGQEPTRCHADAPRGIQPTTRLHTRCTYICKIYDVYISPRVNPM